MFAIDYFTMEGPEQHIPAKRAVERIVNESGLANETFSHVKIYAAWETDEIIGFELMRNVGMSMGCVMIVTVLLLVNIPISFFVFSCVVATLIDLVGFLHFWNMTIDIITCINIVLAIGLCVDYVVHIGHAYLVAEGETDTLTSKVIFLFDSLFLNVLKV
jgi:Niemann-Pick C1 protein